MMESTQKAPRSTPLPLWNGPAPHSRGTAPEDIPTLKVFLPANAPAPTAAVVICAGGGYRGLCSDYEGDFQAERFQARGVAGFVLKYRLPGKGYPHPVPLLDIQRAIRLVRSRAAEWNVDPKHVGVMGFSAGGHLVITAATHFDAGNPQAVDIVDRQGCRPDFALPVYPVVSMQEGLAHPGCKQILLGDNPSSALVDDLSLELQVTPETPPMVLVHTVEDAMVPVAHSRVMAAALEKGGIPHAYHEYPDGPHGFGGGPDQPKAPAGWFDRAFEWLKAHGCL